MGIPKFDKPVIKEIIKEVPVERKRYHFTKEEENDIVELALEAVDLTWGKWSKANREVIEIVIREGLEIGRNK